MTWKGWTEPGNWRATKTAVLSQWASRCHVCGHAGATEVDHVLNRARGGTDDPDNLRPIHGTSYGRYPCPTCGRSCHQEKTKQEQRIGMQRNMIRRPEEAHPGARTPHPWPPQAKTYRG